jgi:acyl-CoA thioesterase
MSEFLRASTWARDEVDAARFTSSIDMRWAQGKGAFGGLMSASLLRAMTQVVVPPGSGLVVRTLHVTYCAPAREGPIEAHVVVERRGALVTTASARATQEGKVVTLATATFVAPTTRPSPRALWNDTKMPTMPAPDTLEALPADTALLPSFTQFFEYRFCSGGIPYSGDASALMGGWVRVRDPYPAPSNLRADAALVAALIDSYPPAVLPRLDEARATASVNLTVDFLAPPSVTRADAQFLLLSSARVGDGGTTDETQELWSEDGVLLAACRQLVAIL